MVVFPQLGLPQMATVTVFLCVRVAPGLVAMG